MCAKHNVSEATFYAWKKKYSGMDVAEAQRLRALEEENRRLKNLVADQAVQIQILKEVNAKKVGPASQRRAVKHVVENRLGQPRPGLPGIESSTQYVLPRIQASKKEPASAPPDRRLERKHPRYGYRRITAFLRRAGQPVNAKRVQRIRCREGFQVSRRQRRCKRVASPLRSDNAPPVPTTCEAGTS